MQFILITSMIIKLTAVRVSIFIHFYYRTVEKKNAQRFIRFEEFD